MALYYGKHKVADYNAWRPFFDADEANRKEAGAEVVNVMQSSSDPNEVHFIFDIANLEQFMGFVTSDKMKEIMHQGGVLEAPTMYKMEALHP